MTSKSPKPLAAMSTNPWEVPGLRELCPLRAPGAVPPRDLPLERLQDFDHSCFAMLKNHRKTTEATAKENSELEEQRERDPEKSADYEPATSSTIVSATDNLLGQRSRELG